MATVFLGNQAPRALPAGPQVHVNGQHVGGEKGQPLEGKTIVVIVTPTHDGEGKKIGVGKRLMEVRNAFNLHSTSGQVAWVESHDEDFAKSVADEFDCPIGRPENWDEPVESRPVEESHKAADPEDKPFSDKVQTFLSDQRESGEFDES